MSQLQVTGEAKIRDIQGPVVANSGVITALDGAASQYVRGDGTLADFPSSSGGGSSVSYYLNSSVSQGTIMGISYRELSKDPIIGAGTDIAISANGYVASYITDANDPDVTIVPGGNFNCEFYFSVNNNTGNPTTYAELYKYDGTTFTLLGTSAGVPESINQGTTIAPYYFAIPVATASLAITDRLAIRIYVNVDGRTVTLHTENGHLCQVVTTLSKGMVSLNNLTDQSQFLTTGTAGTNFAIASSGDTHTFNLPVASATNTGKLSSTDWSTFNNKIAGSGTINNIPKFTASGTIGDSSLSDDSGTLRYQGIGFRGLDIKSTNNSTSIRLESYSASTNADNGIKEIEMDGYYSSFNSYFGYNSSGAEWLMTGYADIAGNTTNRGTTTWQIPSLDGTYGYFDVRSYHSATPIIRAFASNNVVIGGSTNNSFKLEVVGTAKISGVLTLGSTISNGTNTYTLPSITGTLALLEGTQTFSGSKTFSANPSINAGGQSSLSILSSTGNSALILGYVNNILKGTIDISATEFKLISAIDNILKFQSSNNFRASLIFSNSADYSYTFPAASGTIALTSNIPSVSGTSTYIPVFTGTNSLGNSQIWNNGGIIGMGTNYSNPAFYVVASSGDTLTQGKLAINTTSFSGTSVLQVNGAATLTGALSGTSATFSGIVSSIVSSGSTSFRVVNADNSRTWSLIPSTNAAESDLWLYYGGTGAGTKVAFVNNGNVLIGSTTDNGSRLQVTGAATFSSSVTAASAGIGTSPIGAFKLSIQGDDSGQALRLRNTTTRYRSDFGVANSGELGINCYDDTAATYMPIKIEGSKISILQGNVGIGTSNPACRLDILGTNEVMNISGTNATSAYTGYYYNTSTLVGYIGNGSSILSGAASSDFIFRSQGALVYATNGNNERMRIAANGRVGIGTSNPADKFVISNSGAEGLEFGFNTGSVYMFGYNRSTSAYIPLILQQGGGNVGIGTSSPTYTLDVLSTQSNTFRLLQNINGDNYININNTSTGTAATSRMDIGVNSGSYALTIQKFGLNFSGTFFGSSCTNSSAIYDNSASSNGLFIGAVSSTPIIFGTNNAERMRITSGGYFKASVDGTYLSTGAFHEIRSNAVGNLMVLQQTASSGTLYGIDVYYSGQAPNNTTSTFITFYDNVNTKAIIYSNGTFGSRTNTYSSISDIKLKENITPATPKLNDLLKVNVVNYNFIDDEKKQKQIGVISQELEEIFPNMVFESEDYKEVEIIDEEGNITKEKQYLGTKTKSVKYSIFVPMLIKAIQEQQVQIEELKALINK